MRFAIVALLAFVAGRISTPAPQVDEEERRRQVEAVVHAAVEPLAGTLEVMSERCVLLPPSQNLGVVKVRR